MLEKRERGRIQGLPKFFGVPPIVSGAVKATYGFQIWQIHSEGPSEQKPVKNCRDKGAWAYQGTAQFFQVPPIISGTGKATDFKFGQYIHGSIRRKVHQKF